MIAVLHIGNTVFTKLLELKDSLYTSTRKTAFLQTRTS